MLDLVCKLLWHVLKESRHNGGFEWGDGVNHLLQANWYLPHSAEHKKLSD